MYKCDAFTCQPCRKPLIILILVALVIGIYWLYLKNQYGSKMVYGDFMNEKVIDLPFLENCCSWWPISHFILNAILGFFFPQCAVLIIGLGIIWELVEVVMGSLVVGQTWQRQALRSTASVEYSQNWWAGSFKDIIMNITGFFFGYLLNKIFISKSSTLD